MTAKGVQLGEFIYTHADVISCSVTLNAEMWIISRKVKEWPERSSKFGKGKIIGLYSYYSWRFSQF
jgi:hypothetical protein